MRLKGAEKGQKSKKRGYNKAFGSAPAAVRCVVCAFAHPNTVHRTNLGAAEGVFSAKWHFYMSKWPFQVQNGTFRHQNCFFRYDMALLGAKSAFLGAKVTFLGAKYHFQVPKCHF